MLALRAMGFHCANANPQRAKHAINDNSHSCAVAKPLTGMAPIAHKENIDAH